MIRFVGLGIAEITRRLVWEIFWTSHQSGASILEGLKKATWYIQREIERRK